jgi:hypothetical protein
MTETVPACPSQQSRKGRDVENCRDFPQTEKAIEDPSIQTTENLRQKGEELPSQYPENRHHVPFDISSGTIEHSQDFIGESSYNSNIQSEHASTVDDKAGSESFAFFFFFFFFF